MMCRKARGIRISCSTARVICGIFGSTKPQIGKQFDLFRRRIGGCADSAGDAPERGIDERSASVFVHIS
jgi:hypothetical protein